MSAEVVAVVVTPGRVPAVTRIRMLSGGRHSKEPLVPIGSKVVLAIAREAVEARTFCADRR